MMNLTNEAQRLREVFMISMNMDAAYISSREVARTIARLQAQAEANSRRLARLLGDRYRSEIQKHAVVTTPGCIR